MMSSVALIHPPTKSATNLFKVEWHVINNYIFIQYRSNSNDSIVISLTGANAP